MVRASPIDARQERVASGTELTAAVCRNACCQVALRRDRRDVPALVLHQATIAIASLPTRVQYLTVARFTGGDIAPSAQAICYAMMISRRTVQCWNGYVGLARPARVLAAARLAGIWRPLRSRQISLLRAADLVGFESDRTISRSCRRLAGCGPTSIRGYSDEEFANGLARSLLPCGECHARTTMYGRPR